MKPITKCRACESEKLVEFLDLGEQYLSDFRDDDSKPPKYPLVAVFCEECKLVQLRHTTPQKEMYHDRYGFKSGINESVKADLGTVVDNAFQYVNDPKSWLDIASNDGTLLNFVPTDIYRLGVDPVEFLCKEALQYADRIINDYFSADLEFIRLGYFDVITSVSCFYDMPNPSKFVEDVVKVLSPKGVWVIQQNYLLTTMELSAVDNFVHEHIEYYTLLSLENLLDRFGLEVNEVKLSMVNGGSLRTIVSHKGTFPIDKSVDRQRDIEEAWSLDSIEPYVALASRITTELDKLFTLISGYKTSGKSIGILAASTRGATIWQSAGIDHLLIDYAIERNPAKIGRNFSALGIPIISEEEAKTRHPDVLLIGPWFFGKQIADRSVGLLGAGGIIVTPLPQVEIL